MDIKAFTVRHWLHNNNEFCSTKAIDYPTISDNQNKKIWN